MENKQMEWRPNTNMQILREERMMEPIRGEECEGCFTIRGYFLIVQNAKAVFHSVLSSIVTPHLP